MRAVADSDDEDEGELSDIGEMEARQEEREEDTRGSGIGREGGNMGDTSTRSTGEFFWLAGI